MFSQNGDCISNSDVGYNVTIASVESIIYRDASGRTIDIGMEAYLRMKRIHLYADSPECQLSRLPSEDMMLVLQRTRQALEFGGIQVSITFPYFLEQVDGIRVPLGHRDPPVQELPS